MTTLDAPATKAQSLLGALDSDLALRVITGSLRGQIVRLASRKCTIGSAPGCTLRLRGEGIDPWHCVVMRGQERTIVRRLSSRTRLNSRAFDETVLAAGDRLHVGPIELEVLADGGPIRIRSNPDDLTQIDALHQRVQLANTQGRTRLRAVLGKLRRVERRLAEIELKRQQQLDEAAAVAELRTHIETQQATVARQQSELAQRELDVERRLAELAGHTAAHERQLATFHVQQQVAQAELATLREHLATAQSALAHDRATFDALHAGQLRELERRTAEHERLVETFRRQCEAWDIEREQTARELAIQSAEIESSRWRHDTTARRLDAQLNELITREQAVVKSQAQFNEQRTAWQTEVERWQQERRQLETQLAADRALCDERLSALDHDRRELDQWLASLEEKQRLLDTKATESAEQSRQRLARLDEYEAHLAQQAAEIDRQLAELHTEQAALEQQRQQFQEHQQVFTAEQVAKRRSLDERTATLDARANALTEREQQLAALREQLTQEEQRLSGERTKLNLEEESLVYARNRWQTQRQTEQARLDALAQQVNERTAEIEQLRAQIAAEQDRAAVDQRAAEDRLQAALAQLAADQATLHAAQVTHQAQVNEWMSSNDARHTQVATLQQRLLDEQSQFTSQCEALAAERAALDRLHRELDAERAQLAEREQTLQAERAAWEAQVTSATLREREAFRELERRAAQLNDQQHTALHAAQLAHESQTLAAEQQLIATERQSLHEARAQLEQQTAAHAAQLAAREAELTQQRTQLDDRAQALNADRVRLQSELDQQRRTTADECDRRAAELAVQAERLAEQQATLERESAEIVEQRTALAREREQSQRDHRQNDDNTVQMVAALAQRESALDAGWQQLELERQQLLDEHAAFERARQALAQERETWLIERQQTAELPTNVDAAQVLAHEAEIESRLAKLEEEYQERCAELESAREQLRREREALDRERGQLAEEREAWHEECAGVEADLQARQQALSEGLSQLESARQVVEHTPPAPPEPTPEPPRASSSGAGLSTLELFKKLGVSVEDEPAAEPPPPPRRPAPAVPEPVAEEDDIDSYMQQLLQRNGGAKPGSQPVVHATPTKSQPVATTKPEPIAPIEPAEQPKLLDPSEMKPRSQAPELQLDMSAMREVANLQARAAINKHQQSTERGSQYRTSAMMALGVLLTMYLAYRTITGDPWGWVMTLVSGAITISGGLLYLAATRRFRTAHAEGKQMGRDRNDD